MTDKRVVLSTAGSEAEARKIAQALVERRLAACVNIVGPVHSIYRWQGAVESAPEYLLIIKTTQAAFPRVLDAIRELHAYQVPECIMLSIEQGSEDYLRWVAESVDRDIR
jgi:periplasmic divalent cation tolerance protein